MLERLKTRLRQVFHGSVAATPGEAKDGTFRATVTAIELKEKENGPPGFRFNLEIDGYWRPVYGFALTREAVQEASARSEATPLKELEKIEAGDVIQTTIQGIFPIGLPYAPTFLAVLGPVEKCPPGTSPENTSLPRVLGDYQWGAIELDRNPPRP